MDLNEEQLAAVDGAVNNEFIYSITGSAGTGKSTVIKTIYERLTDNGKRVAVIAPTGRAANLLRKKMDCGETIHKFLNYYTKDNGESYQPRYGRDDPITGIDVVIVDEASMVNRSVFDNLLSALPNKCKVVLVGDINQLPPIEETPQDSAFKICLNRYPKTELKQRYRFGNQLTLSKLSDAILDGSFKDIVASGLCYRLDGVTDSTRLNQLAKTEKYWTHDCQIISPTYKGVTGCDYINKLCQLHRWGENAQWLSPTICKGDKVIATINANEFTNGDLFDIVDITKDRIVFSDRSIDRYYRPVRSKLIDLSNCLKPAYCITTHKSQGGEYTDVVYVLGRSALPVVNRANIYTGVTRSSDNFVMLYDYYTLTRGLAKVE